MKAIWYLLKCPEGSEADYTEACQGLIDSEDIQEVVCFRYQRMLRYKGSWHVENRILLPGCIFLSAAKPVHWKTDLECYPFPYKLTHLKSLCSGGNVIGMSRGILKQGNPVVTDGPLKGRERLIRRIDRHKRTAEIQVLPDEGNERMVVGLEIYEKQQ